MNIFFLRLLVNSFALLVTSYLLDGMYIEGLGAALMSAFILGIVNAVLKPILLVFTLPLNVLTLGLFTFVVNGLVLKVTASLVSGFYLEGFWTMIFAAIIISLVSGFLNSAIHEEQRPYYGGRYR